MATIRRINEEGEPEGFQYRKRPEKLKAAWVDIVTNPDLLHIQDWDDLDSNDCDNFIQIFLFGKTIYGLSSNIEIKRETSPKGCLSFLAYSGCKFGSMHLIYKYSQGLPGLDQIIAKQTQKDVGREFPYFETGNQDK